jgi:uncharacterized protein (TIGR03437 family)
MSARRYWLTLFLSVAGFVPGLAAQQYCISGDVMSVQKCTGCAFQIGDPVAMTFTVTPGSTTCIGSAGCTANGSLAVNIGTRYWKTQAGNAGGTFGIVVATTPVGASSAIHLTGGASLSPVPTVAVPDQSLFLVSFQVSVSGNLTSGGGLPAALPPPVSGETALFSAGIGNAAGTVNFSYTGQSCAIPGSASPSTISSVVNGASFTAGAAISPGSWVAIFGSGLAPAGDSRKWNEATEIVNGVLPVSLDGTSVTVNGKSAAVEFIQPSQVNIQAPDDTAAGPVQVVVTTTAGVSNSVTVNYQTFAPGLFPATAPYLAAQHADNSYVTTGSPAKPGEEIILWGTGFGPANPAVTTGHVFSGANPLANPVTITIGGQPATVDFAGVVGAGLVQINVHVPASISNGDAAVVAMTGGVSSQTSGNLISIHN